MSHIVHLYLQRYDDFTFLYRDCNIHLGEDHSRLFFTSHKDISYGIFFDIDDDFVYEDNRNKVVVNDSCDTNFANYHHILNNRHNVFHMDDNYGNVASQYVSMHHNFTNQDWQDLTKEVSFHTVHNTDGYRNSFLYVLTSRHHLANGCSNKCWNGFFLIPSDGDNHNHHWDNNQKWNF